MQSLHWQPTSLLASLTLAPVNRLVFLELDLDIDSAIVCVDAFVHTPTVASLGLVLPGAAADVITRGGPPSLPPTTLVVVVVICI